MVSSCPRPQFLRRRRAFLLLVALYLLVGIAFAAPANAEHLSHKRSHARKSIEIANANAKRSSQRSVVDSGQQDRRALLDINLPGLGAALGDDGTLLGVTVFPNATSASASASDEASATSSVSSNSTSSASESRTSSSSAAGTSMPSSTSSPEATPTPSSSSTGSLQTPVPSPTSISPTARPAPSSSCVGLLGIDLICTPETPSSSVTSSAPAVTATKSGWDPSASGTSNSGTAVHSTGPTTGPSSTVSGGAATTPGGSIPTSLTPSSSSDDSCKGVVSLDLLGNPLCVLPTETPTSSTSIPPASISESSAGPAHDTSSVAQPNSSGNSDPPQSVTDTPSTTCSGLLCGILPGPTSESSTAEPSSSGDSNPPSATDTASTTCSGLLCGILPGPTSESSTAESSASATECTGLLCGILPTSSGADSTTSGSGIGLTSETSAPGTDAPSATSDASSCSGLFCGITSVLPTITSAPPETTSAVPSENSTISESATPGGSEGLNSTITSASVTTVLEGNATSTSGVANATSTEDSSITFPTGNSSASRTSSLITLTPTSEASIASQFSFLTQSSLLFSEVSSSSLSSLETLTNPDEPTSSATLESAVTGATVTSVPLPSGLPARIYPAEDGVTANTDLSDHTPVSILFDRSLGWKFVATNTDSAAQLFAYFPNCLQVALGVSSDQIKTFALQVLETSEYKSPDDADELRTLFIAYIPSENVTALEQAIKAKQSDLYTKTTGISAQLAQRIDASYSVTSNPDPISENPDSSSSSGPSSSSNSSRRDAIIGVCSALGGIALCILGFLIYRNFKRRQETAHHRLGEQQLDVGPVPGQDFDRDSIGGQRRRSFYYAEDSLRGYSQPPLRDEVYAQHISLAPDAGGSMRERRPIVPGTISAPILRDNTLNW